jgi:hypothetical protein
MSEKRCTCIDVTEHLSHRYPFGKLLSISTKRVISAQAPTLKNKTGNFDTDVCFCIWKKSNMTVMNTWNLFEATNICSCNLTYVFQLYIYTSPTCLDITTFSFDNHLPDDSNCRPKHATSVSHTCKLLTFHFCAVNGINTGQYMY